MSLTNSLSLATLVLLSIWAVNANELEKSGASAPSTEVEPQTPPLPSPLQKLTEEEKECLFMIFTKSKLFEDPKVQEALAKQACDSKNASHAGIWASDSRDNGWCELNLEKVNSEFGPMVMHAQGAVASSKGARLFVMPTKHGIWIALYQRNCVRQEKEHEKEEEDKNKEAEKTVSRLRRWVLDYAR